METDKIQTLLNQVKLIKQKNDEILDATGGRFNIFKTVGVNHYENTHSAILAEFLNPNGSHGLKAEFLKLFLKNLPNENKSFFSDDDCEKAKVTTEYYTQEGRIDIFIKSAGKAIIVENKIYAEDQWEQLKRYQKFAKDNLGDNNYLILYLTLFGIEASEHSGKGVNYTSISYEDTIIKWLEESVHLASRYPLIRETIIQYVNHLKQLTNQDMDTKNSEEILEILYKKENIEVVLNIINNTSELYKKIISVYLVPSIKNIAEEMKLNFYVNPDFLNGSAGTYFQFYKQEWNHLALRFAFDHNNYSGFYWCFHVRNDEDVFYKNIRNKFLNWNLSAATDKKPYGDTWHIDYRYWNSDVFMDIVNGNFVEKIRRDIEQALMEIEKKSDYIL